jgi:hypothetical protein
LSFVAWVVLLEGPGFPNFWPACIAIHAIGGGSAIVVVFAFLLAGCAGVFGTNEIMATGKTVLAHVACDLEWIPIAVAASAVTAAAVAAYTVATNIAATCIEVEVLFCCCGDCLQ